MLESQAPVRRAREARHEVLEEIQHQAAAQLRAIAEVVVDVRLAHSGSPADVPHSEVSESSVREQLTSCTEQGTAPHLPPHLLDLQKGFGGCGQRIHCGQP